MLNHLQPFRILIPQVSGFFDTLSFSLYYLTFLSYGLRFLCIVCAKLIRLDKLIKGYLTFFTGCFHPERLRLLLLILLIFLFYLRVFLGFGFAIIGFGFSNDVIVCSVVDPEL